MLHKPPEAELISLVIWILERQIGCFSTILDSLFLLIGLL